MALPTENNMHVLIIGAGTMWRTARFGYGTDMRCAGVTGLLIAHGLKQVRLPTIWVSLLTINHGDRPVYTSLSSNPSLQLHIIGLASGAWEYTGHYHSSKPCSLPISG